MQNLLHLCLWNFAPGRVSHCKLPLVKGPDKVQFTETLMSKWVKKKGQSSPKGYHRTTLEPGLHLGPICQRLVALPVPIQVSPKAETWAYFLADSLAKKENNGQVHCELGGRIPSTWILGRQNWLLEHGMSTLWQERSQSLCRFCLGSWPCINTVHWFRKSLRGGWPPDDW